MPSKETMTRDFIGTVKVEMRADDDKKTLKGYAAVFNNVTDMDWYDEVIQNGAFENTILNDDIRALWNHDTGIVLGRKENGTLRLAEDDHGLKVEIDMPDTTEGDSAYKSIKRGDVSQMSFGFFIEDEIWSKTDGRDLRTIQKVKLLEVSPVTFPAYESTEIYARSLLSKETIDIAHLAKTIYHELTTEQRLAFRAQFDSIVDPDAGDPKDFADDDQEYIDAVIAIRDRSIKNLERNAK